MPCWTMLGFSHYLWRQSQVLSRRSGASAFTAYVFGVTDDIRHTTMCQNQAIILANSIANRMEMIATAPKKAKSIHQTLSCCHIAIILCDLLATSKKISLLRLGKPNVTLGLNAPRSTGVRKREIAYLRRSYSSTRLPNPSPCHCFHALDARMANPAPETCRIRTLLDRARPSRSASRP